MRSTSDRSRGASRTLIGLLVTAFILAGCVAAPAPGVPAATAQAADPPTMGPGTPTPDGSATRVAGWTSDLEGLLPAMAAIHPDLDHGTSYAALEAAVEDLTATDPHGLG